jgi:hypothetical protein
MNLHYASSSHTNSRQGREAGGGERGGVEVGNVVETVTRNDKGASAGAAGGEVVEGWRSSVVWAVVVLLSVSCDAQISLSPSLSLPPPPPPFPPPLSHLSLSLSLASPPSLPPPLFLTVYMRVHHASAEQWVHFISIIEYESILLLLNKQNLMRILTRVCVYVRVFVLCAWCQKKKVLQLSLLLFPRTMAIFGTYYASGTHLVKGSQDPASRALVEVIKINK